MSVWVAVCVFCVCEGGESHVHCVCACVCVCEGIADGEAAGRVQTLGVLRWPLSHAGCGCLVRTLVQSQAASPLLHVASAPRTPHLLTAWGVSVQQRFS